MRYDEPRLVWTRLTTTHRVDRKMLVFPAHLYTPVPIWCPGMPF
jgi:hypothetical protein